MRAAYCPEIRINILKIYIWIAFSGKIVPHHANGETDELISFWVRGK